MSCSSALAQGLQYRENINNFYVLSENFLSYSTENGFTESRKCLLYLRHCEQLLCYRQEDPWVLKHLQKTWVPKWEIKRDKGYKCYFQSCVNQQKRETQTQKLKKKTNSPSGLTRMACCIVLAWFFNNVVKSFTVGHLTRKSYSCMRKYSGKIRTKCISQN